MALFVGGEWERKGLRPAIEALAGAPGWTLAVAGDGDRSHFEALARSLGVFDRIRWLGLRREVAPLYAMADAFLLPTSYETFSLATFEAAASGVPLLVTPVNGVRELLEPGVNGFFIDRRPDGISEALRQLSDEPARRLEMGRAARRSSLRFGWENTVELHRRLYRRLAGGAARNTGSLGPSASVLRVPRWLRSWRTATCGSPGPARYSLDIANAGPYDGFARLKMDAVHERNPKCHRDSRAHLAAQVVDSDCGDSGRRRDLSLLQAQTPQLPV